MSFNELTDAQVEVLVLLSEEASEVIKAVSKILRHGLYSCDPTNLRSEPNILHLCYELGDLEAAKDLCGKYIDQFNKTNINNAKMHKLRTVDQWCHHATAEGLFETRTPNRPRPPGEPSDRDKSITRMIESLKSK